jgi:hypothetical protein
MGPVDEDMAEIVAARQQVSDRARLVVRGDGGFRMATFVPRLTSSFGSSGRPAVVPGIAVELGRDPAPTGPRTGRGIDELSADQ